MWGGMTPGLIKRCPRRTDSTASRSSRTASSLKTYPFAPLPKAAAITSGSLS